MPQYNYAMCDFLTGNIDFIMNVAAPQDFVNGKYDGRWAVPLDRETDHRKAMEETYWDTTAQAWQSRSAPPTPYYKWTIAKKWELDSERVMTNLRVLRHDLLAQSDWTQMPDNQLSDSKKAEWATYRQALRDVPDNVKEDLATLDGFAWPSQPS
jgi:hypothetical protein